MSLGNQIVISGEPKGVFFEGTVDGTPSPGTLMEINAAVEPVGGRFDWTAYAPGTDGNQRLIAVLIEDKLQGKLMTDAYVDGDRCFLYCPLAGEHLNMLVSAAGTATSDAQAIGDLFIGNTSDGLLVATTGTPESEPFMCMETISDVIAGGTLTWVMATGY